MKINERIRNLRKTKMTQADMATAVGVSLKTIGRWESGERIPDAEELTKVASVLETSVAYLIGESEPPRHSDDEPSNVRGPFVELIRLPILSAEITACCGDGIPLLELTTRSGNFFYFPKNRIGRIDDLRPPFGIDAEGDSMAGYGVFDGALVAVNPAEELRSGHIAVVCIGDRVSIKKIYFKPSGIELKSSDGRSPTLISQEDIDCGWFKVLGKVMGTVSGVDEEP
jgi:SOS-response transcriptional repressor LexA